MIYVDSSVPLLALMEQIGGSGAAALMLDHPRDLVVLLTHDARLAGAARAHGLEVIDPAA